MMATSDFTRSSFVLLVTFLSLAAAQCDGPTAGDFQLKPGDARLKDCVVFRGHLVLDCRQSGNETSASFVLPKLESVVGSLSVRGRPPAVIDYCGWRSISFSPLPGGSQLKNVTGAITLSYTNLTSLSFLSNLEVVGRLFLVENPLLETLDDLSSLREARELLLSSLPQLTSIAALHRLTSVPGSIQLGAAALPSLEGLHNLTHVAGHLRIEASALRDLEGLRSLHSVGSTLSLRYLEEVETLDGLRSLSEVGALQVTSMRKLASVTGLSNLREVTGKLSFMDVHALEDLDGLEGVESIGTLLLAQMSRLRHVRTFSQLRSLGSLHTEFLPAVESLEGFAHLQTLPGQLSLVHLASLRNLTILSLKHVGSLSVQDCPNMTRIDLDELQTAGSIILTGLDRVTDFSHLAALRSVSSLSVSRNAALRSLTGFNGLTSLSFLSLYENPLLEDVNPLRGLTRVEALSISDNARLRSLGGLCQITQVDFKATIGGRALCCDAVHRVLLTLNATYTQVDECGACTSLNNVTCPCTPRTCQNSGLCTPIPNGYTCSCLNGYSGAACERAQPNIITLLPPYSPIGGWNATLIAQRVAPQDTILLTVGEGREEKRLPILSITPSATPERYDPASTRPAAPLNDRVMEIRFVTPPLNTTGYIPITLTSVARRPDETGVRRDLLYYVVVPPNCLQEGLFWDGATCRQCPRGGYCPGGDRVWPIRGFWSPNERTAPTECFPAEACPGALGEDPAYPVESTGDGRRRTARCAEAYTGRLCSTCAKDFYREQELCRSCGLEEDDRTELIALVSTACAFYVFMGVMIGTLSEMRLAQGIQILIAFQQAVVVGGVASNTIGSTSLSRFFSVLGIVNFSVEFVKPGCQVPRFEFVSIYWATIGVFCLAAVVFVLASALRAYFMPLAMLRRANVNRIIVFKRRGVHALVILGSIVYLQFCLRSFQGITCETIQPDNISVLSVERNTECYKGAHLATAFFIWISFFVYGLGFPIWCASVVRRTARMKAGGLALNESKTTEKYGFLWRGTKARYYWFRLLSFVSNFAIALQDALAKQIALRTFLAGSVFLINTVLTGVLWPYRKAFTNLTTITSGVGSVAQVLALLMLSREEGSNRMLFFWIILGITLTASVVVLYLRYRRHTRKAKARMHTRSRSGAIVITPADDDTDEEDDWDDDGVELRGVGLSMYSARQFDAGLPAAAIELTAIAQADDEEVPVRQHAQESSSGNGQEAPEEAAEPDADHPAESERKERKKRKKSRRTTTFADEVESGHSPAEQQPEEPEHQPETQVETAVVSVTMGSLVAEDPPPPPSPFV